MRNIMVKEHHENCNLIGDERMHSYSFCSSWQQVFYFNGEFVFIEMPSCNWTNHSLSSFEKIEIMLENSKHKWVLDVNRSISMNTEFKNYRIRGARLKKWVDEVNFLYYDNAGRRYAVTTKIKFTEDLINQSKLEEEYKKAKDFLKEGAFSFSRFSESIDDIYKENKMYISPHEEYLTLNHLRLELNRKYKKLTLNN
jgi:hypothetical protein